MNSSVVKSAVNFFITLHIAIILMEAFKDFKSKQWDFDQK